MNPSSSMSSSCRRNPVNAREPFCGDQREERERTRTYLQLVTLGVGHVHVVRGRAQLLQLLVGEDVGGDQMDLGVAVLAGLGRGHVNDLARTVLDDAEATLAQGRALERTKR